jgi:hypothetical protein
VVFAFGQLRYLPRRLLDAADKDIKLLLARAAHVDAGQLSAVAMAFAKLGYSCAARTALRTKALQRLRQQGAEAFGGRTAANFAWANAVLSIGGCGSIAGRTGKDKAVVMQLAAACREVWGSLGVQDKMELHQVHLWLQQLDGIEAVPGL